MPAGSLPHSFSLHRKPPESARQGASRRPCACRQNPSGLIAIEGEHLVAEAVRSHLRFASIFLRDGYAPRIDLPEDADRFVLPPDVFASVVATEQPQGIAALVHPPAYLDRIALPSASPLILVLAGLQDPGNVGTLLRSAEAFGSTGVLLLPGTASPWNQKALRASAGSAFRVPAISQGEDEALNLLAQQNIPAVAAVARGGTPINKAPLADPVALLIGNEGAGLSDTLIAAAAHRITIPMPGNVESLNAAIAGSLLLYEVSRQRRRPTPP